MPAQTLRAIYDAVDVPILSIGGINRDNIGRLAGSGVDGAALVSAIFSAADIEKRLPGAEKTGRGNGKRLMIQGAVFGLDGLRCTLYRSLL